MVDEKLCVVCIGIVAVTAMETMAMYKGVDGTYLSLVIGAILTLVGYVFGLKRANGGST